MSPGKCISPPPAVIIAGRHSPIMNVQKSLTFGSVPVAQKMDSPNSGLSWADKVKGLKPSPTNSPNSQQNVQMNHEATPATQKNPNGSISEDSKLGTPKNNDPVVNKDDGDDDDDDDGWEIVARGKHRSRGSSTSVSLKTSMSQDSVETLHMKNDQNNDQKSLSLVSPDKVISTVGSAFEKVEKSSPKSCGSKVEMQSPTERVFAANGEEKVIEQTSYENESVANGQMVAESGRKEVEKPLSNTNEAILEKGKDSDLSEKEEGVALDVTDSENYEELMFQEEMDGLLLNEEQQEEDRISRQMEEENEKALASAIEEEEHLTKELEDEALKNMDDEFTEDVSSDKEGNNTDEGQYTPRDANELDESVSIFTSENLLYLPCFVCDCRVERR